MNTLLSLIFFVLLASTCHAHLEHSCNHDKDDRYSGEAPATIVLPPEKQSESGERYSALGDAEWRPIRFLISHKDLDHEERYCTSKGQERPNFHDLHSVSECGNNDVITDEKKNTLLNFALPRALQLHSDRLKVKPIRGLIKVPRFQGLCGAFTYPLSHTHVGVQNADMIMYVAAGPTEDTVVAWASTCSRGPDGRPVVGVANFGPHAIEDTTLFVRVAAHEIAHALGFSMPTFEERQMGDYYFARTLIRGLVTSSKTREKAREHFGCDTIDGMELENEGGGGTADSHWERRNAKDELMAGMTSDTASYTAITMAAFEDLGYYKAIWGTEEHMNWGKNAGCEFLTGKCIIKNVNRYPEMFCTKRKDEDECSSDRAGLGYCTVEKYSFPLHNVFQYFTDPYIAGKTGMLMDHCPFVQTHSDARCYNTNKSGHRAGASSKCLRAVGLVLAVSKNVIGDVCVEVDCTNPVLKIRYAGNDDWLNCPEGTNMTPSDKSFSSGYIICPRRVLVCTPSPGPSGNTPQRNDPRPTPVPESPQSPAPQPPVRTRPPVPVPEPFPEPPAPVPEPPAPSPEPPAPFPEPPAPFPEPPAPFPEPPAPVPEPPTPRPSASPRPPTPRPSALPRPPTPRPSALPRWPTRPPARPSPPAPVPQPPAQPRPESTPGKGPSDPGFGFDEFGLPLPPS